MQIRLVQLARRVSTQMALLLARGTCQIVVGATTLMKRGQDVSMWMNVRHLISHVEKVTFVSIPLAATAVSANKATISMESVDLALM